MKRGAYKFEERSQSYMGGFSGSKGKGKFNDIINTKKSKIKGRVHAYRMEKQCGQTLGEGGRE